MPHSAATGDRLRDLDDGTRALVRLAAVVAGADDETVRRHLQHAVEITSHAWIDELLLQTYLFAGFPRALNAMREWRRVSGKPPVPEQPDASSASVRALGEATCATVYGEMYDKLRRNVRDLHPLLDEWMIVEGYGKVLSRPALDLPRRELCIVAACAATGQDRQLQSHLHGARNAGVAEPVIGESLDALRDVISSALHDRAVALWRRIRHDIH